MDLSVKPIAEDDERKLKNLATRIMSNGVEVLVKDKSADAKQEQRKVKYILATSLKPHQMMSAPLQKTLLSSAVATFINNQHMSALFPIHQLMQHNYIIKTCMTTYTYLTTVVHNKRSAISTFETILSVVTTESLTNLYATDMLDIKPTKTKYLEVKTIQPTTPSNMFVSSFPKIDKRIDTPDDGENFDLIEPSEHGHVLCTTSCSCSHTKTEGLKTKYTNLHEHSMSASKYGMKTSKYGASKIDLRPTKVESFEKKTQYRPYEYEASQSAPTDRIVEKYTEVINDYSEEKESNSVEESELLTNEQAPVPTKTNKLSNKNQEKPKPDKPQKPNKNKVLVSDLLKLGSLGIKGLSQLAPVIEKMTGGFMKRNEPNKTTLTTTTTKPAEKLTPYNVNKRLDSELESKHTSFPIYIPVDELETSESQLVLTNATLHQNLAWAAEHKQSKAYIATPKVVHESPLVNGGIPISPGEIITANSDVIVGKPAVGGPLTLAASGIKLHNPVNPPPIDSFVAGSEQYLILEKPSLPENTLSGTKVDDSFDLRPPEPPKAVLKPNRLIPRPPASMYNHPNPPSSNKIHPRLPLVHHSDQMMKTEHIKTSVILGNHGRPAFLDYIPSLAKPSSPPPRQHHNGYKPVIENNNEDIPDNSPSSSEIVDSKVSPHGDVMSKPFLVDIQPSKVANVLIPHGSSTALVFAGSSEPHKTGEYVDDPLPYPEPGYFGSFSIDAPQMTNVHNVTPNNKHFLPKPSGHSTPMENYKTSNLPPFKEYSFRNDLKYKWKDNKRPIDYNKIPPPTSNQETHVQVGPHITVYNPDIYKPNNGEFEKYNHGHPNKYKDGKEVIDKEYENYLAVPPPPPKMHYNPESHFEKNKPYNQRPMVHTKPIQDMKVFLNIQHPIPKQPSQESQPPKVTSEIYYAAQATHNKPGPTYTIRVPPPPLTYGNIHTQPSSSPQHIPNNVVSHSSDSFTIVSSPDFSNKSVLTDDFQVNHKDNTYTVTLNTAANVANNVGETAQVIGTSIPVDVGTSNEADRLNTNIPIGTNFAIKVEDGSEHQDYERYNSQGNKNLQTIYNDDGLVTDVAIGDNRWNLSNIDQKVKVETKITSNNYYNQNYSDFNEYYDQTYPAPAPSLNSHANFPMMNEATTLMPYDTLKPVTEYVEEETTEQKRPAKLIPNIPTNSHGWYSSVLGNENSLNNMNKIIIEQPTTRKIIPLLHEYGNVPNFGQKITSVGKPPSEFWTQNQHTNTDQNKFSIGRPFTRTETTTDKATSHTSYFVVKPPDYIPSYFDGMQQPAYDIPIRDNSDETTTARIESFSEKEKPVYENTEEVYDGEEETANTGVEDGELSQESMKVPVVTTSSEDQTIHYVNKSATDISLLQDEVSKDKQANSNKKNLVEFDPGTQTEKPFTTSNKTMFHSNAMKPIYNQMRPRPFTTSTLTTLDHQLQQPHWQINQLMINSTNAASYEEGLDLNIGEEISLTKSTTRIPQTKPESENKFKRPTRPVYYSHEHENVSNIITSTVNIKNKKPLIVEKNSDKHISTLSPILLTTLEINRSSSEILDLSPPPPTLEYSFKPSTNDELIMGMSPPPPVTVPPRVPQRNHITSKPFLNRTPSNYRTKPPRTLPPRGPSTQRPIRRPISRDEISTYKPTYDVLNNIKRPVFNRDQPSSQLLPPPLDIPTRVIPINDLPSPTVNISTNQNVVFPTPLSSGWLTSSTIDFSSSFDFNPSSVQFPEVSQSTEAPVYEQASTEDSFSYEHSSSSERNEDNNSKKSTTESRVSVSKESSTEPISERPTFSEENVSDSFASETSQEDATTDKIKVIPIGHKNRTRRPYPVRHDDRKSSTNKYKIPSKSTPIIKPTRTLSRPDILFPTRHSSTRKIIRPIPTRSHSLTPSIIESSEHSIDDDFVKPTEVLKDSILPTSILAEKTSIFEKSASNTFTPNLEDDMTVQPIHHTGNEVKVSDEIIPTKTEFKTSVITLTKTLSEPPRTVSSIGYLNVTHTLTVTHTMTSLISQSEGAITQTLILTNRHTSTVVDIVTEVYTQVQPTTIVETVTKHIPISNVDPTHVQIIPEKTVVPLDDLTMSSEENENLIVKEIEKVTTENIIQKIETENEGDNDTFFVVMNKSQNGGKAPPIATDIETGDYDITRNEQVNNGVSQVLFGEILLAGTPYLETSNVVAPGIAYMKECQPDCKASRNERCQRIDGMMKCVCRPGFARMFPDRPCKPTYTYSVKLALGSQGQERLKFNEKLYDNTSKEYHALAVATHEGINRMVMQSDLRDVYHGVHITGFQPVDVKKDNGESYQGVMNNFYVQLSDNAHESRLKEVIEKYLRNNNYSLGGIDVHAAGELVDRLDVSDFDECTSGQFHDCSEHAQCFNLRGTYTCSCLEGFADLSVNNLYPGRICSAEPVGCELCNYHGACYSRDDRRVLCECFQWYAGSTCHINLKVVLISLVVLGALLTIVLTVCAIVACRRPRPPPRSIVTCIQGMPSFQQGAMPKQRADRRALISDRTDSGDASSVQNASLPYMPTKQRVSPGGKKLVLSEPPAHEPPPVPAPAVMIPRARLHPHHADSRENISRKKSMELSSEAKLISYLESGAVCTSDEMRRKHSMESSYSANKDRHNKQGALVSAGFKVSTTIRAEEQARADERDDGSSINKNDLEAELHFDSLRKSYSQEDLSEWTDAERRIGELTLSEARSVGGTLPASTGRATSSTRLTHQEANTMAERDLGSTFLLPHVHLYKPDLTSDVSEFDSL